MIGAPVRPSSVPPNDYAAAPGGVPDGPSHDAMVHGYAGHGSAPPQGFPPHEAAPPPHGFAGHEGAPPHAAMHGSMPPPGMIASAPGPYALYAAQHVPRGGVPTVTGEAAHGSDGFVAKYKELSLPQKALVILAPFCVLTAAALVVFDRAESVPMGVGDGGTPVVVAQPTDSNRSTAAQPCPAGYVPLPGYVVQPGAAFPCIPAQAPDAGTPLAATGQKTLERQAVDYVAAGDYLHAASSYDELLLKNPDNRVYAEAARILRAKADGGAP
jgi:hypothetical protein